VRIINLKTPFMKKTLFLAAVLVAGAASVSIAQFSNEKSNNASAETIVKANSLTGINFQDTTKPKKDSLPPKQDSTSVKF
jgi:hypothetical protein